MINALLQNYITKAKSKNIPDNQILHNLITAGWNENEVRAALNPADDLEIPIPPESSSTPVHNTSMWDAFEHILLFISLYVMTLAISLTLHYFVDKYFPKISSLEDISSENTFYDTLLRGYLSALIVSTPLFIYFFLKITKRTQVYPPLRQLKSRKFLIYLTLVVTFLILIGNAISTVYGLLSGNVTLNFFMHLIVTALVCGIIFTYYLNQVKEDRRQHA